MSIPLLATKFYFPPGRQNLVSLAADRAAATGGAMPSDFGLRSRWLWQDDADERVARWSWSVYPSGMVVPGHE